MIIPDRIVPPSALVGLAAAIAIDRDRWWVHLVASVGAALFLVLLAFVWRGGMGAGDVKLALFMGAVLGALLVAALLFALFLGAVIGVLMIVTKRTTRKDLIPFGP